MAGVVAIGLVVGVGVGVYSVLGDLPGTIRGVAGRWDAPVSDDQTPRTFVVPPGQSGAEIGGELHARGLIRSPFIFRMLVEARGVGGRIEAGEYQLSPSMTTNEVITVLSRGAARRGITLTIPEGWRAEQAAQKVEALGLGSAADFMALVRAGPGALARPTASPAPGGGSAAPPPLGPRLADAVPAGQSLEGYLFPDTYEVAKDADVRTLVDIMTRQFERKFTPELRQRAASNGLSVHQVVTLASIVEREAARPAEQPMIASVYLNRLKADMPLQADPTVQFAVANADPAAAVGFGFWKQELTAADLRLDSPYNTYLVRGLPPGPICSPGASAIEAVVNPAQTDYYYFVARGDGSHAFARTEPEHRANVERHQGDR